ncbi:hypothetical protein C6502_09070 [Candidatus Poribacteria bacterium]|nr:MAG: hypothetical protein C6502_09070 [Candidatus Poribacteria bacterium]
MKKQFFCFTLFLLVCLLAASTAVAQVEISAVPSATNPAVGYQIEVSINIAGGANVAGYDFRLTFNSTELELISIKNSDYLPGEPFRQTEDFHPDGTYVPDIQTGDGSARFAAVTLTGTAEGDGTLAIAKFKVLAETETTIGLEDVVIGDRTAQPIALTSVTGTTLTPTAADTDLEYLLSVPMGISLIHVPLKVNTVDGEPFVDIDEGPFDSVADLYDVLGGANAVNFLITYDTQTQEWRSFFVPLDRRRPADVELTDDKGVIADLRKPVSVRLRGGALGTNGTSTINLNPSLNVVGLPLNDSRITRVSDLLTLEGISGNIPAIILTDGGEFKLVGRAGGPGDVAITGGQSFILNAGRAATVSISGVGWSNTSGTAAAPPGAMVGIEVSDVTPILALRGSIVDKDSGLGNTNFRVTVQNRSNGRSVTTVTESEHHSRSNMWESAGVGYQLTDVDLETKRAATVGDILEISAQSIDPLVNVEPLEYTVTAEDVRQGWIQLPALVAYEIPAETALLRNYPNPFNPETWIPYQLAHAADVTLTIYDTKGALVRQLDLGYQQAGYYTNRTRAAYWDGRNHLGERVGSGVYFYQLRTGDYSAIQKMVILK